VKDSERKTMSESEVNEKETTHWDSLSREVSHKRYLLALKIVFHHDLQDVII
jgi:hypothetical protein